MSSPPVSVVPGSDESIPSMLRRLQAATGCARASVRLKSFKSLYDDPDAEVLDYLGGVLGVGPSVLAQHTLRGRLGDAYDRLGWRDHRQPRRLICGACGQQTFWSRLVLVTACSLCGVLLTEIGISRASAPEAALDLQAAYLDGLTGNRPTGDRRIERFWRLLSFHLCTGWWWPASAGETPAPMPMPIGTELGRPRNLAWRDPEWIADFATVAWPATETTKTFREHVKRVAVAALLARAPDTCHLEASGLEHERDLLHRQIRRWRLEEHHVPDHLLGPDSSPLAGCHLEAIGYALSRAMRREIVLAHTGHRPTKDELIAGRGQLRQAAEIAAINQLLAEDIHGIRILLRHAGRLAEPDPADRIDYQERRSTLAILRTVPATVLRRLSSGVRERPIATRVRANPLARDAAAWLWVELAGGVLHHSPHHGAARRRVAAFDRSLTHEDRLVLLEYGHDVLGAVADDVARQHTHAQGHGGAADQGSADVG